MLWQYSYDVIPLVISALVSIGVAIYVLRLKSEPWSLSYSLVMMIAGIWSAGYAFEVFSVEIKYKIIATYIQYIGVVGVPAMWLIFISQYLGRDKWVRPLNVILLWVLPLITLLLAWTSAYNKLVLHNFRIVLINSFAVLLVDHGPVFWLYVVYSYLILIIMTVIMVMAFLRSYQTYRDQMWVLIVAVVVPWIGNALYNFGLSPNFDLTSMGFTLGGLLIVWSILRYRFLNLVPVARETVVEKMADGMIVLNLQSRIVDLNPAAQKILGCAVNDAIGAEIEKYLPDHPEIVRLLAGELEAHSEMIITDDELLFFDLHISTLKGKRGEKSGRLIILTDITERKQAEAEREKMLKEIQKANESLKKMDRTKDEFLSIVTHDLKTPLTVIIGYTGVILSGMGGGEITPQQRGMLESIKRQANSQQEMIDTILDYTRMEFGRIFVNPEKFSLKEMAGDLAEAEKMEAAKKQISITVNLPAEDVEVKADKRMMGRVINNLIGNALKYTDNGGTINVSLERHDNLVKLVFADTGIGIALEHLDKIFQKFFIVDTAGARERRSLGLGLTIVKSFIEAHNGRIWAESEGLGRGSRFNVEFPLEYQEKDKPKQ